MDLRIMALPGQSHQYTLNYPQERVLEPQLASTVHRIDFEANLPDRRLMLIPPTATREEAQLRFKLAYPRVKVAM